MPLQVFEDSHLRKEIVSTMVGNLAEIRKKSIGSSWGENDKREKVMLMMRDSD